MTPDAIHRLPVRVEPTGPEGEYYYTAELTLPFGCEHRIGFTYDQNLSAYVVSTARLRVPEKFQEHGIGTTLLFAGFALAKSFGVTASLSSVSSPYALMARRTIFGEDNIIFFEDQQTTTPIDIGVDEAIEELGRGENEFTVVSSLVELDTSAILAL